MLFFINCFVLFYFNDKNGKELKKRTKRNDETTRKKKTMTIRRTERRIVTFHFVVVAVVVADIGSFFLFPFSFLFAVTVAAAVLRKSGRKN